MLSCLARPPLRSLASRSYDVVGLHCSLGAASKKKNIQMVSHWPGNGAPGMGFPGLGMGLPCLGMDFPGLGMEFPCLGMGFPGLGMGFPCLGMGFPGLGMGFRCSIQAS